MLQLYLRDILVFVRSLKLFIKFLINSIRLLNTRPCKRLAFIIHRLQIKLMYACMYVCN